MGGGGDVLKAFFDRVPSGVCVSDEKSDCIYFNPEAGRILGFSAPGARTNDVCRSLCGYLSNSDFSDCCSKCPLRDQASSQKQVTHQGYYRNPLSPVKHLRVHCMRLGAVTLEARRARHITILQDISAEVDVQERKEDWRNMIIHDLRTSLAVMLGALHLLPEYHSLHPSQAHMVEVSLESGQRMMRLLSEFLDLARLDSGLAPLHSQSLSIAEVVERCVREGLLLGHSREIRIRAHLADQPCVSADPELLHRVMTNLITNAVEHTPDEGLVTLLGRSVSDRSFELSFKNTGQAIDPEDLPHVFDRFNQAGKRRSRDSPGTGLGLAFCREALKMMGGAIEAVSWPGEGAEFLIRLPLSEDCEAGAVCGKGERVLNDTSLP